MNPYEINNELEKQLCEYTGAKYCVGAGVVNPLSTPAIELYAY